MSAKTPSTPARSVLLLLLGSSIGIAGCTGKNDDDLDAYIHDVNARPAEPLDPVPEPEPARSYRYPETGVDDPFEQIAFGQPDDDDADVADGPAPDPDRPREPLERFALDSLRMSGILERDGNRWALIRDSGGTVHRVRTGNYIGENHGEIKRITENRVEIVELVPAQEGGWREREVTLRTRDD